MPWFKENDQYSDVGFDDAPDYAQSHPKAQPVTRMHDENGKTYAIPYGQEGYYASQNPNLQIIPSTSDQGPAPSMGQSFANIPRALVQGAAGTIGNQLSGLAAWAPQVPGFGAWALDKLAGPGTYAKGMNAVAGGIQSAADYIADPEKLQQQQRLSAINPLRVASDTAQSLPAMGVAMGVGVIIEGIRFFLGRKTQTTVTDVACTNATTTATASLIRIPVRIPFPIIRQVRRVDRNEVIQTHRVACVNTASTTMRLLTAVGWLGEPRWQDV